MSQGNTAPPSSAPTPTTTLLVVEDEPMINQAVTDRLAR